MSDKRTLSNGSAIELVEVVIDDRAPDDPDDMIPVLATYTLNGVSLGQHRLLMTADHLFGRRPDPG